MYKIINFGKKSQHFDTKIIKYDSYKVKNYLFNSLIQFIQRETAFSNINTLEKVQMFWNYFYSNGCMKNKPWEAFIIRNGNWETVMFENEEILYGLLNKRYNNFEEEAIEGDIIIEDDFDFYISSDENGD